MAALLPNFVVDLETDMQEIVTGTYSSLAENMWWQSIAKKRTTGARRDILFWFIDTFRLRYEGVEGGNKHFEELVSQQTEITHAHAGGGIILKNDQLLDQDGRGLDQAACWSRQAAAEMAYWPQEQVANFMKTAHLLGTAGGFTAYDLVAYFSAAHLLNPARSATGTFANLFTGTAVTGAPATDPIRALYPGACPIDESVSLDVAAVNLKKVFSYVRSIFQPNGTQPRRLKVDKIFCGPALYPRACQLLNAKFFAQVAASGAGSADTTAYLGAMEYSAQPVLCEELAGFESDTSWFVSTKTTLSDPYGAIVYTERDPFAINFYGTMTERELKQRNELEYHVDGRNSTTGGHPDKLFKVKSS